MTVLKRSWLAVLSCCGRSAARRHPKMPVTAVVVPVARKVSGNTMPSLRNTSWRDRCPRMRHRCARRHDMSAAVTVVRITGVAGQTLGSASEHGGLRLAHTR